MKTAGNKTGKAGFFIPSTISREAQRFMRSFTRSARDAFVLPADPADTTAWQTIWRQVEDAERPRNRAVAREYRPLLTDTTLGGVPVLDIRPRGWEDNGRVIVYTHGGCYTLGSARGSLMSSVPVAHDTGTRVISVDYTVAPTADFDEITEQAATVIAALLASGYRPGDIAVFGDSAGGALISAAVLKMRDRGLDMPGAAILVSPWSDISETGDTAETLKDADPLLVYPGFLGAAAAAYAPRRFWKHPHVSPVYADYTAGFPPTLIQGGTRDILLSCFVRHFQALDRAGVTVKLDLYEGMWHVFQALPWQLPEAKLARRKMADFLDLHMGREDQ